jgi:hypothetical protein
MVNTNAEISQVLTFKEISLTWGSLAFYFNFSSLPEGNSTESEEYLRNL